jgi:putative transcriptional regulator
VNMQQRTDQVIDSRISEILGRRRESITDLSRGTGISYATCHALYHGTSKMINFETLDRLCRYFDCQPGDLYAYLPQGEA